MRYRLIDKAWMGGNLVDRIEITFDGDTTGRVVKDIVLYNTGNLTFGNKQTDAVYPKELNLNDYWWRL